MVDGTKYMQDNFSRYATFEVVWLREVILLGKFIGGSNWFKKNKASRTMEITKCLLRI